MFHEKWSFVLLVCLIGLHLQKKNSSQLHLQITLSGPCVIDGSHLKLHIPYFQLGALESVGSCGDCSPSAQLTVKVFICRGRSFPRSSSERVSRRTNTHTHTHTAQENHKLASATPSFSAKVAWLELTPVYGAIYLSFPRLALHWVYSRVSHAVAAEWIFVMVFHLFISLGGFLSSFFVPWPVYLLMRVFPPLIHAGDFTA